MDFEGVLADMNAYMIYRIRVSEIAISGPGTHFNAE